MREEQLNYIRTVSDKIRILNKQIKAVYNSYNSPVITFIGKSKQYSEPTATTAYKALELQSERDNLLSELLQFEIELSEVTDYEVVSIIRWHYLLGLSWEKTSRKIYGGRKSGLYCKRMIDWFLKSYDIVTTEVIR